MTFARAPNIPLCGAKITTADPKQEQPELVAYRWDGASRGHPRPNMAAASPVVSGSSPSTRMLIALTMRKMKSVSGHDPRAHTGPALRPSTVSQGSKQADQRPKQAASTNEHRPGSRWPDPRACWTSMAAANVLGTSVTARMAARKSGIAGRKVQHVRVEGLTGEELVGGIVVVAAAAVGREKRR